MCNTHSRYRMWHLSIVDTPSQAVAYSAKMQSSKIDVALLSVYTFFGMKVWNGIWKKILVWNGIWKKILVWNEMEENCQYGIWKNRLLFHAMPCRQHKSNKIACKVNLPAFFCTKYNWLFHTEQGCGSGSGSTLMKNSGSRSELGSD